MLDLSKPIQTRDGRKARIICTDRRDSIQPIVALVTTEVGEVCSYFGADGRFRFDGEDDHRDLVNVPEKVRVRCWLNVYPPDHRDYVGFARTRRDADAVAAPTRIACIEIDREVEVGEGL